MDLLTELKGGKLTPKKIDVRDHASIGLASATPAAYHGGRGEEEALISRGGSRS